MIDLWTGGYCVHISVPAQTQSRFSKTTINTLIISLLITTMNKDFYITALDRQPRIACLNLKHKINANNGN